jgi:DNA-binding PadR family transcriptional regulator
MGQLTRVRLQKGRHLVKRGEIWYLETCAKGLQERKSLGTGDLPEATRLAMNNREPAFVVPRNPEPGGDRPRPGSLNDDSDIAIVDIAAEGRGVRTSGSVDSLEPSMFLIMLAIGRGEVHGYAIMRELERFSGGRLRMGAGTLYRLIRRMRVEKVIEEVEGERGERSDKRRRTYRLSGKGLSVAREQALLWEMLAGIARARGLTSSRPIRHN